MSCANCLIDAIKIKDLWRRVAFFLPISIIYWLPLSYKFTLYYLIWKNKSEPISFSSSLAIQHGVNFCRQRMLERHGRRKELWFLVLLCSLSRLLGHAQLRQHQSPNNSVVECLQLDTSSSTAFPGTLRMGFQQVLECGFLTSSTGLAPQQSLCHAVGHRRETYLVQTAKWCMKNCLILHA